MTRLLSTPLASSTKVISMPSQVNISRMLLHFIVIAGVILVAWANTAEGHDFYDAWCCSGDPVTGDCAPAPAGSVTWSPSGWQVQKFHETVPFGDQRIRYNPPGVPGIHICEYPADHLRCLYLPEPQG